MSADSYEAALDRAAQRCGVEPRFWDIFGREHVASIETRQAIVRALGIPVDSAQEIHDALDTRDRDSWMRMLGPSVVTVAKDGRTPIRIAVPERLLGHRASYRVELEGGGSRSGDFPLEASRVEERREFEESWVSISADIPEEIPLGYHHVDVNQGPLHAKARLIVAPECAYQPDFLQHGGKTAGLAVALYGVRSERNWGFGDFTDLKRLSTWAATELGVSFVALNPLHALHNRRPYNTSPYLPNSIFFQNLLYLDIEAIPEWKHSHRAQRCFATKEVQREIAELRAAPSVEYERVHALKLRFLKLLFARFLRDEWRHMTPRAREFAEYRESGGQLLERFALYCALDENLHRRNPDLWIWTDWPAPYQHPESPGSREFARKHWRSVLFYEYAAWLTAGQLREAQKHALDAGLPIGLYHDLALATDRFGSDLWAHREFFAPGCRVGSPPDDFSPQGQDWGFPPPNTVRHREDGYHLFRESIRRSCESGGALRIDHVMRFFRLYWIPDGMDATRGAYVLDRANDMVSILASESVRNRVLIVGEDLGTVEPYIRERLEQVGILSYRLFFFERHHDGSYRLPHEYPRQALVSSSTHDLPTLTGFWKGSDIEARRAAGVLDENGHRAQWADRSRDKQRMLDALSRANLLPHDYTRDASHLPEMDGTLHSAIVKFLASTPCMLMLVNQEDLTLEPNQQNLPGTTEQYPNWGRKMRFTLEELESDPTARQLTARMREDLRAAGR
jgi:4-alpha-glucanotransferase